MPTSIIDVTKIIQFRDKRACIHPKAYYSATIRYYRTLPSNNKDIENNIFHLKLVKRRLSKKYLKSCKFRTMIITAKYHYYNKQPSKFRILGYLRGVEDFTPMFVDTIKKVE